ncbi:MAG: winged helix-turn-helix transcriptional regulator [Clostridiales bacterium]|nr:winged helix-turn-helix transcriptional regulator [Clostridiales bacterium]
MRNADCHCDDFHGSLKLLDELDVLCRKIDKRLQKHSSTSSLFGQGRILSSLAALDGISQSSLSKSTSLSPATVTEMLDKLEAAGFVKRVKDNQDSRKILVYITAHGRSAVKEMDLSQSMAVSEFFSVLSRDEIRELERLLSKLNRSLGSEAEQPEGFAADERALSPPEKDEHKPKAYPEKIRRGIRLR